MIPSTLRFLCEAWQNPIHIKSVSSVILGKRLKYNHRPLTLSEEAVADLDGSDDFSLGVEGVSTEADVTNSCLALTVYPASRSIVLGLASLPLNHSSAVRAGSSPMAGG